MLKESSEDYFWPGFVDLMTCLFFIVLVLFILSYNQFSQEKEKYKIKEEEYNKIEEIKNNLKILMSDKKFFIYEKEYKRYRLSQQILYYKSKSKIDKQSIPDYESVKTSLLETGNKLKEIIEKLKAQKESDTKMKDLSYLVIISGRSSDLPNNDRVYNYQLSYMRAFELYNFWIENINFDLDDEKLHKLIDFQIAGNGIGGVGRFPKYDDNKDFDQESEELNQSFLIQIIPKIGEMKVE